MKDLKSKIIILVLSVFLMEFLSCNANNKKAQKSTTEIAEEKLNNMLVKYNCKEEYENARYFYYCKFYNKYAEKFSCSNIKYQKVFEYRDSIPISFLNISLFSITDVREIYNDSLIYFHFRTYLNDSCYYIETSNNLNQSPAKIMMNIKTKRVEQDIGHTNVYFAQNKNQIDSILNNKKIKPFIFKNKSKINKWFLSEYLKRNNL